MQVQCTMQCSAAMLSKPHIWASPRCEARAEEKVTRMYVFMHVLLLCVPFSCGICAF